MGGAGRERGREGGREGGRKGERGGAAAPRHHLGGCKRVAGAAPCRGESLLIVTLPCSDGWRCSPLPPSLHAPSIPPSLRAPSIPPSLHPTRSAMLWRSPASSTPRCCCRSSSHRRPLPRTPACLPRHPAWMLLSAPGERRPAESPPCPFGLSLCCVGQCTHRYPGTRHVSTTESTSFSLRRVCLHVPNTCSVVQLGRLRSTLSFTVRADHSIHVPLFSLPISLSPSSPLLIGLSILAPNYTPPPPYRLFTRQPVC